MIEVRAVISRKIFMFLAVLIVSFTLISKTSEAVETISTDEIKPGMKGYGLTVFSQDKIERFEVEVIDVVPNSLPQQDMILIMCKGEFLEGTKVIAGMSGSPIYIEGRLAGALAYGWSFSQNALAGVAPIENMLKALDNPGTVYPGNFAGVSSDIGMDMNPTSAGSVYSGMKPIATPLFASGFSQSGLDQLTGDLSEFGLVPVAGGGLGSGKTDPEAMKSIVPGSPIGVSLMTGDKSLTAIGTTTWREGNKILAFGHPFLFGGSVNMPIVSAKIHTVVSTQSISFKLGSPMAHVGRLVGDEQACIVGEIGKDAQMIPIKVKVRRPATKYSREFNYKIADVRSMSPMLIRAALTESMKAGAPSLTPTTVKSKTNLWLKGYGETMYEDTYAVMKGNFTTGFMDPVFFLMGNPFEKVSFDKMEIELEITDDLNIAFIDGIWSDTDEVSPGETVDIGVLIRPYNKEPVERHIKFKVPKDLGMSKLIVAVSGGLGAKPDAATPKSVEDMIKFMDYVHSSDSLVVSYRSSGSGVDVDGTRLKNLPDSVSSVLKPVNVTGSRSSSEIIYIVQPTKYVILDGGRLTINIRNGKNKRR